VATIHRTTMEPTKLELLTGWIPQQGWWVGGDRTPRLVPAGGFRLDDPVGEVGIEFMFVTDASDGTCYHVPLSYRAAPLAGAEDALIGTSEHGVLGTRWIYDGTQDPVVTAALLEFVQGRVPAQHQKISDTLDPTVVCSGVPAGDVLVEPVRVLDGAPVPGGSVEAGWRRPDGTTVRGPVASVR
jgi:Maltokinase N-terminal cap domain